MKKPWKLLLYAAGGIIGIWLTVKLLLPVGLPFLFGYGLSKLAEPMIRTLTERLRLPRWLASLLVVGLLSAAIVGLLWLFGKLLLSQLQALAARLPSLFSSLAQPLSDLHAKLLRLAARLPQALAPVATQWLERLFEGSSVIVGTVSDWAISFAGNLLAMVPDIVLFLLTTLLSAYLFSSGRKELLETARRILPEAWVQRFAAIKARLRSALGGYCKAQLYLILVTFSILCAGLLLLRQRSAILIALLTALIDALPVFGSGTVLIPWGILSFLRGDSTLAVGLFLLYAASSVTRAFLEPRFLGRQIGLHPLLTLLSLYAGFRFFGVLGMILVPVGVILLKQLYEIVEAA